MLRNVSLEHAEVDAGSIVKDPLGYANFGNGLFKSGTEASVVGYVGLISMNRRRRDGGSVEGGIS